jgi:signal peptidase II
VKPHRPPLAALGAVALVLVADQAAKLAIAGVRARLPYHVFDHVRIEYVHNTGMSFSLFTGHAWVFTVLSSLISLALAAALVLAPRRYALGVALILGGSLGNLIDRFRLGYVIDFVGVYTWPTFNVADIAIVGGAALLVLAVLGRPAQP